MKTEIVTASHINPGDTILIGGKMFTVGKHNISNGFMGTRLYGQRFPKGCERVLFPKFDRGEIIGYFAQI